MLDWSKPALSSRSICRGSVQEMLQLLKVSISKHVILKINLDPNLSAVWGHAPQLRQVVMNLVINASEAIGEKDGVINVTTEQLSDGKNLTPIGTDLPAGDYVRLEVSDTGCGITEEAKAKIFDPFLHHQIRRPWFRVSSCPRDRPRLWRRY